VARAETDRGGTSKEEAPRAYVVDLPSKGGAKDHLEAKIAENEHVDKIESTTRTGVCIKW
jgi:hypothetical protein